MSYTVCILHISLELHMIKNLHSALYLDSLIRALIHMHTDMHQQNAVE